MAKKMIRFVHILLMISLIVSMVLNYGQYTVVEARTTNTVKPENTYSFSSSPTGKITFTSDRSGNDEIYVMNADGSNVKRITANTAADKQPAWSPDGAKIAFVSNRDGTDGIYVMNSDGTQTARLTNSSGDWFPEWSPDGMQIAFYSGRDNNTEIFVMNSDGTDQKRLTAISTISLMPTWSPDSTKIAYISAGSNPGIFVMNSDGSNPIRISTTGSSPSWSPDGTKIAYVYNEDIYSMDADGNHQTRLTNNTVDDSSPKWSPDGTMITFTSWRDNNYEIYVMNADGSSQTRITNNPAKDADPDWVSSNAVEMNVATLEATNVTISSACLNGELVDLAGESGVSLSFEWSTKPGTYANETLPSEGKDVTGTFSFVITDLSWGTTYYYVAKAVGSNTIYGQEKSFRTPFPNTIPGKIAFISTRDGIDEIYSMNTDGSNQVRLTGTEAANCGPVISPDGSKIIFYSFRDGPIPEIYVMNVDGTNQMRITNNAAYDVYPTWTPDGNKIVFVSNRDGSNNIYIMNNDGTSPVRLTDNPLPDEQPSCWSPDGTRIAFASVQFVGAGIDGYEIYTMNLDGSNKIRLTYNSKRDFEPAWSPDGTKIAFTSWRNLETEIFIMDSDGSNQTKLASGAYPTWSPDGTKIAFTSWYWGNPKIFIMNADGSNQTQLTNSTGLDSNPCWGVVNGTAPSLGGSSVTDINTNSTELEGNLTSFGSAPDAYVTFEWGVENNTVNKATLPITQSSGGSFSFSSASDNKVTVQSVEENITYTQETPPIKMSSTGSFSFSLTNLDPGTTYYFRSKAFRHGTSYSRETSFKTKNLDGSGGSQASSIMLTTSPNPSVYGQEVTFTAAVNMVTPATGVLGGTVTFQDGTMIFGSGILNTSGQTTYSTSTLSIGSHSISAFYGGDANFVSSTSAVLYQNVWKRGDANLDGTMNMGDVTKVERIILGLDPATCACDANGDGKTNMGDVTKIERIILRLDP